MACLPQVEIPISALVPIQPTVHRQATLDNLANVACATFEPVKAVLYQRDLGRLTYLLVDGHHRAYIGNQQGSEVIKGMIAATDEELAALHCEGINDFHSIEAVHQMYESTWKPNTIARGVSSIADLIVETQPEIRQFQLL
jgi:hypothetical protein